VSNKFQAEGDGTTATGGIEITAGSTTSVIAKAFSTKFNNATRSDATTTGTHYVLLSTPTNVTLGPPNAILDFTHKGVMTFNGVNGKSVTFQGGTFTTNSSKPIGEVKSDSASFTEFVLDTEDDDADGVGIASHRPES
jgi:hypothetical protein